MNGESGHFLFHRKCAALSGRQRFSGWLSFCYIWKASLNRAEGGVGLNEVFHFIKSICRVMVGSFEN